MDIVDLQLHEPAPFMEWEDVGASVRRRVLTESMLQSLDTIGANAAVLYPLEDAEWADELAALYPERFATVVNLGRGDRQGLKIDSPELEQDILSARSRGLVGVRVMINPQIAPEAAEVFLSGAFDRALALCEQLEMPLFIFGSGRLDAIERTARAFPELQLVIDHMGLPQPPYEQPDSPWSKAVPELVSLSAFPNVAIKMCCPTVFSDEAYPFSDVWPHVERIIDAYGVDRVAWASDIGRFRGRIGWNIRLPVAADGDYPGKHTHMDSLAFFLYNEHLSPSEKAAVLGGTARKILNWPMRTRP
ncbi:MAG: amidohydrolase family protein [Ilumatobacteraceae bacterium]